MRDELALQTYDVLLHGLKVRDQVASGERPYLGQTQAKFKSLLGSSGAAAPWGSEHDPGRSVGTSGPAPDFLGIRYALTCWLDAIMTDAGWTGPGSWDENKLELSLYRSQTGYNAFWHQARLAETVPDTADVLEAFLLCVLLGFRGELGEQPERLREWVQATRSRVTRSMGKELPPLPERAPVTNVPELLGIEKYRKMTQRLVAGVLFAITIAAFFVVVWFG